MGSQAHQLTNESREGEHMSIEVIATLLAGGEIESLARKLNIAV